jgi:hypothetical protein
MRLHRKNLVKNCVKALSEATDFVNDAVMSAGSFVALKYRIV